MKTVAKTEEQPGAEEIQVELMDGVATITLNRPRERNPLGVDFTPRMLSILEGLEADSNCRAVVLTGSGKGFCSGADLKNIVGTGEIDMEWQLRLVRGYNNVVQKIRGLELPVIAAVNGPAVGGGAALALACDIAIACPEASYFFAFGRIGASAADMGCTYLLPRHIGAVRAAHLILTGATVDAAQGQALGLFVQVVPQGDLLAAAQAMGRQIAQAYPRRAAAITKLGLRQGESNSLETCLSYEAIAQSYTFQTEEHRERLGSFLGRGK
ncbi:MAG: enoyl-CoA hydratase-related protein [bacterium]